MGKARKYLEDQGNAFLARVQALSFEDLKVLRQPEEELYFRHFWRGHIKTHIDHIDEHTIRVVVHGVLEFRLLGNYCNYVEGFRRNRDGSFEKLTEADYYEFD